MHLEDGSYILIQGGLWGRIFILNFAYISPKYSSDPGLFP